MKKRLILFMAASVALLSVAATIRWYSDMVSKPTIADDDGIAIESSFPQYYYFSTFAQFQSNVFSRPAYTLNVSGDATVSNALFTAFQTNGTYIVQPANAHGSITLNTDTEITIAAQSTYYRLTNFVWGVTNMMTMNATNGFITNLYAGYYDVRMSGSINGTTANSQLYECAVFTNNVECTLVEWERTITSIARGSVAAGATVFLPADCAIEVRVKSDAASPDNIVFEHYTLTVTTP